MLVLIWLLMLMMMRMMKSAEIITAHSGDPVLLSPDIQGLEVGHKPDIRWTRRDLMMRTGSRLECPHRRCQLLENGSLSFNRVLAADSGNYSVEVFHENGQILKRTEFLLIVTDSSSSSSSSSSSVLVSVLTSCFLLLSLIFITLFILMRMRNQGTRTTAGPLQENVYVEMHGNRGNKKKDKEEEKQEREEESHYVCCDPAVSMETPNTQQMSVDVEDIYV